MHLTKALELLVLGLSAMSVAEATFVDVNVVGRDGMAIEQRQGGGAKGDPTDDSTTTTSTKTTETTTPKTTTSTVTTPTTSSTPADPTNTSSTKTTSSTSSPTKTTPTQTSSSSSPTDPSSSTSSTQSVSETPMVITTQVTITSTLADGSHVTLTTPQVMTTKAPGLVGDNNGGGQNSGMSPQTRNTVIGVVVGVGGAIILGGLALVAWRIWGRKRHQEENDGLMDYGSTVESKPESGGSMSGRTPFQSTLESYHAPTQVNTAANF